MSATLTAPDKSEITNGPSEKLTKSGSPRKQKRMGPDGKAMHRLIAVLTDPAYKTVKRAIARRSSDLYGKAYDDDNIVLTGDDEEDAGRTLEAICNDWLDMLDNENAES